jgi:hypothetical protein
VHIFRTLLMVNAVAKRNTTLTEIVPQDESSNNGKRRRGSNLFNPVFGTQKHLSATDLELEASQSSPKYPTTTDKRRSKGVRIGSPLVLLPMPHQTARKTVEVGRTGISRRLRCSQKGVQSPLNHFLKPEYFYEPSKQTAGYRAYAFRSSARNKPF